MDWIFISEIAYAILVVAVCLRVIYDTNNVTKTLGYLLLVIFVPIVGMLIYFSIGVNYRKNKLYSKKISDDKELEAKALAIIKKSTKKILNDNTGLRDFTELSTLLLNSDRSPLTDYNKVQLLINGEEKFPEVLKALESAQHHIHIEYYIYENDNIGRAIENILIRKAKEGVEVRFIYDDFGSSSIRKNIVKNLKANGVQAFPFFKIKLIHLANRLNYRNHRKIIVIDGKTSFVGGINVSDKYINSAGNALFWRDTHLKIEGKASAILQHTFIGDWNFCSNDQLPISREYFPNFDEEVSDGKIVQITASGAGFRSPIDLLHAHQSHTVCQGGGHHHITILYSRGKYFGCYGNCGFKWC